MTSGSETTGGMTSNLLLRCRGQITSAEYVRRLRAKAAERKLERFHRNCDRLGVPQDVRERMLRLGTRHVDWYAGRTDSGGPVTRRRRKT